jgi:hypothetical protein
MVLVVLNRKTIDDYNKHDRRMFAFLSIAGDQRVIGSASIKEMKYTSDLDLMEHVVYNREIDCYKLVLDLFREKFRTAYASSNIWITDFKCGVLAGDIPIRWNRLEIEQGCKIIDDKIIKFIDCLQQKSTIKMDVISLINDELNEISENYYIHFGDFITYNKVDNLKTNIETSLLKDIQKYKNKGNAFKALKRLFSYLRISKKSPSLLKMLLKFFNSSTGELGSVRSDLEIITIVIDQNFRPASLYVLKNNLKTIEKRICDDYKGLIKLILSKKTKPSMLNHTNRAIEIINEKIQILTEEFINSNIKKLNKYI